MIRRFTVALLATFVFVACSAPVLPTPSAAGQPTAPPPSPSTGRPTGERDLIFGLTVYGWPWPVTVERPAEFSLYGDGRAIYLANRHALPGALPVLQQAQLSGNQIEELLGFALREGGLSAARGRYEVPDVVDHDWTVFAIDAGTIRKEVWVYALGEVDSPDDADRVMFERLADVLDSFANEVAAGRYQAMGAYTPEGYAASLSPLLPTSDLPVTAAWPWLDLDLADFEIAPDGTLTRTLTPAQGRAVIDLGIGEYMVVGDEAGHRYVTKIRPLLPHEVPN